MGTFRPQHYDGDLLLITATDSESDEDIEGDFQLNFDPH
jgi:hypothetical protein